MIQTMKMRYCLGVLVAFLPAVLCQSARAQANRATVTGIVSDPTGAVIQGVDVTATNADTNVPTKTVSNHDGIYVLPNLFPGRYNVTFEKTGFETVQRPDVVLHSTEEARIDAAMTVGSTSATVTVNGGAPVLDMDTASVGTNMKADVVEQLPLSIYGGGRFVEDFAVAITPGYSVISSPYGAVVNGGQWFSKDYTVDGTSGTSNIRGDTMENGPSMEAVEEVQAQTSGLDAQSAITGGGVMTFNLKSGTNKLHGSAFLYGLNEMLDANTWTNDNLGTPKAKDRGWDYGFSLGGPIHKDKTFFFGTFERFDRTDWRLNSGGATVPTSSMLKGDFSGLLGSTLCTDPNGNTDTCSDIIANNLTPTPIMVQNNAGQTIQAQEEMIYDPNTGNQFTGNVIPTSRLSGVAQKVNSYYAKYAPNLGGVSNNERTLLSGTPSQTPVWYVVKLDHVLGEKDRLSGSWIHNRNPRLQADSGGVWQSGTTTGGPLSNLREQIYTNQQYRISESHTFSTNMLNVLNFTDSFDDNGSVPADPGSYNSQVGFGNTGSDNFPEISFSDNQTGISETYIGNTWQGDVAGATATAGDALTWNKGRHTLSFGGDSGAHEVNYRSGTGAYNFSFSYLNTAGPGYPYDGFGFATYELGLVNQSKQSVAYNLYGRQKNFNLYAQDSYKLTPKLTVNMGLRWSYYTRFKEKNGNWANFDPTVANPQLSYGAEGVKGSLVFAKNGNDSFDRYQYPNNYGPTLGIAYQFLPNVVVHASYGLIFNPVGVTFFGGVPDSFAPQLGSNSANNFGWDAAGGGGNYPGVLTKATSATDPATMSPFPVETDPRSLRLGYSEAFNFGVQQQLTPNMRFELSYVGNRGHRLTDTALAWNETSTANFLKLVRANPGMNIWDWGQYVYGPADAAAYGVPYPYSGFYGPPLAALAPFPQMAAAEVEYWYYPNLQYAGLPLGQSFYDSLVADVVKRTGRGLTMDMSYVWSRSEGNSFSTQQDYNGFYTGVEDFQNMHGASHALTGYDLPQVVKGFVSYELPFGKGQRWGATQNPVVRTAIGGWTASALLSYYTGQPFRVGAANPYWPLWGNIYPQFNLANFKGPSSPGKYVPVGASGNVPLQDYYMPSSVAGNPPAGYLPPSTYDSRLRCPGQAGENTSLLKNDKVGPDGRYNLSIRMDFYNLFNRHYYNIEGCGGNSASIGSSTFGEILGVGDNPRQGQFAIRLDF